MCGEKVVRVREREGRERQRETERDTERDRETQRASARVSVNLDGEVSTYASYGCRDRP